MDNIYVRIVENLFNRLDGPLHFRFIFQPLMAGIFATIDGINDAKDRRTPYLWTVLSSAEHRMDLLKDGWKHAGKIFIAAVIMDTIYQIIVYHTVYPGGTLTVAFCLAIVPYCVLRGSVNWIIRIFGNEKKMKNKRNQVYKK